MHTFELVTIRSPSVSQALLVMSALSKLHDLRSEFEAGYERIGSFGGSRGR